MHAGPMRPLPYGVATRLLIALAFAVLPAPSGATPLDFIPVVDPLEDELRVLDVIGSDGPLPHLSLRPLQVIELPDFGAPAPDRASAIAFRRLARALARDRGGPDTLRGAAPRLLQFESPDDERFEISAGLEGSGVAARHHDPDFSSPSGVHLRFGVQTGRWLAHSHLVAGHVENGLRFAEAILPGNDAVFHSEEAYLAYTGGGGGWGARFGRSRWHWGPGEEASLTLSKTSPAFTALAARARLEPLRADLATLSGTLDQTAGEQPWTLDILLEAVKERGRGVNRCVPIQAPQSLQPIGRGELARTQPVRAGLGCRAGQGSSPPASVDSFLFLAVSEIAASLREPADAAFSAAIPAHS